MSSTYLRSQRHILLDMHIPDWDERFLAQFDPAAYVDLCASAGAQAVMVYANSHAGQCYWPTRSGHMHRSLGGHDVVGETVALLRDRGLAVCAYYSAIFNNWAYATHPEWRIVAAEPGGLFGPGTRYGQCCPSNPAYLDFMLRQTEELAGGYAFDAFFYDCVFWPDVCVCDACRARWREEAGAEIPEVVDWCAPEWCAFQDARERWLVDAARQLRTRVKASLEVPVFLNAAICEFSWVAGASPELIALNDVMGGDFRHVGFPLSAGVTPTVLQYMHPISGYGGGVSDLESVEEQTVHAFTAVAFGGQYTPIDAVEPDGRVNAAAYEHIRETFDAVRPYEAYLGGRLVADVAVYESTRSHMDLSENGRGIGDLHPGAPMVHDGPHWIALRGALRALGEAHLPATVITRADLGRLAEFPVVVLPNVLRMDRQEVEAFRAYVAGGGRLYASGASSLLTTDGAQHDDFLLADVLGCHRVGVAPEAVTYLRPATGELAAAVAPIDYVAIGEPLVLWRRIEPAPPPTALDIRADADAEVLVTATLPYAGGRGSRDDEGWANIHSSPPWEDTARPVVVRHAFGAGQAIYAAVDVEAGSGRLGSGSHALFVALVRLLLGREPAYEAEAHPNVVMTGFHDTERSTLRLCFLNAPASYPALPIPAIPFRLACPEGARFSALRLVPDGEELPFSLDERGDLRATIRDLRTFAMVTAHYTTPD